MKTFFIFIIVALSFTARAQEIPKITPEQAKDYVDKKVMVCGEVKGTYVSPQSKTVFLNFGAEYPNESFQVIVFADSAKKFSESPATLFVHKNICVTGMVKLYEGKPEITVSDPKQIQEK